MSAFLEHVLHSYSGQVMMVPIDGVPLLRNHELGGGQDNMTMLRLPAHSPD